MELLEPKHLVFVIPRFDTFSAVESTFHLLFMQKH